MNVINVIKRDGRIVPYDNNKVQNAICSAMACTSSGIDVDLSWKITEKIFDKVSSIGKDISVEDIQDMVEHSLMVSSRKDAAKEYIIYRNTRSSVRSNKSELIKEIGRKIMAIDVQNQNANVDEKSFGGRRGQAADIVLKEYALNNCMSELARSNHINNEIYIHDLNSYATGMHNCASRDTKFITDIGVMSFENLRDGENVTVLTHKGNWKNAVAKCYGKQKLNKITFSRAGQRYVTQRFTENHRWLVCTPETGEVYETTSLKVGDVLIKAPIVREFDFDTATPAEQYYWCLGFVLGDGTEAYRWSHGRKISDIKFVRLRLCGEKTKFVSRFNCVQHSVLELDNGDLYLTFGSTTGFHKHFPNLQNLTLGEKKALFDGLYSADGSHSTSCLSIMTTDEQIASFIEDVAPSLGYYILSVKELTGEKTNYGIRGFTKEYKFIGSSNKYYWKVVGIEEDAFEDVWCFEVEDDHSFVLPNGIVTGNCLSLPFDDLLANGFKTRQTDVRPANSINTAFQLVAVIFQLQSLNQFGGCSATHLDWTMVPYVRKSFYKHYIDGLKYAEGWGTEPINIPNENIKDLSIESPWYAPEFERAYNYAIEMTERELRQAVEGMYHNLNLLGRHSGNAMNIAV